MARASRFAVLLGCVLAGCTSYGGIAKAADGKVYITGTSGFFVFTSSFVKRCTESGNTLTCDTLTVADTPAAAADKDDGDEETPKPKKKKKKPADDDN
jgi:hypothetical protein